MSLCPANTGRKKRRIIMEKKYVQYQKEKKGKGRCMSRSCTSQAGRVTGTFLWVDLLWESGESRKYIYASMMTYLFISYQ